MNQKTIPIVSSVRAEILIDRPIEAVWACIFEFPKWAPTIANAELLSGEWDKEGCVMLLTKKDWVGLRPFYSTMIKMDPLRQQVYNNVTKDGDQLSGFVDLTFSVSGKSTNVVYSSYGTLRFETGVNTFGLDASHPTRQDMQGQKVAQQIVDTYLRPLKEYAEKTAS